MLSRLIDLSLGHRFVVIGAAVVLVGLGLVSLAHLPFDAFPDTTPVQVVVNSTAPTLSPLEVERQITFAVEQAIFGLPGLTEVRSVSKFGLSQIVAVFEDGTDVYRARQVIAERLQAVDLPDDVGRPSLGPASTGLGEVFQYLVRSDQLSAQELRTLHHWVIRPQMLQVPGVAEINTWGGHDKQYQVIIDPDLLTRFDLDLDDVAGVLQRNNANVGGGTFDQGGEARLVQGIGLAQSADDIGSIVIAAIDGAPVRIRDIARVEAGNAIRRGAVTAGGEGEAVLGLGFMLMGENSRELTRRLEERLDAVRPSLPPSVTVEAVYSRTGLVDAVLRTVRNNLLEGALLVIAVLFAFLGNLRAGLVVALAIPLSMLFAFNMMVAFGIAGSLMSLGAIDFGLVVDSSVILVENAARRVGDDASGRSVVDLVRDAAVEVRKPTLFGELIIAIVYLPILVLEGVEGRLFRPMALTVIFALAGSMILSLTLMPALASLVLRRGMSRGPGRLVPFLRRLYRPALDLALARRGVVVVVVASLLAGSIFLATRLGSEFVPRLQEEAIVINTVRQAGVSLDESIRYGTRIEQLLLAEFPDEIEHIWTRTGSAEVATDPMGLELSDVFLTLRPRQQWTRGRTQEELVAVMSGVMEGLPGMRTIFTQPIEMRMNEMIAGIRADVGIKLFGDDFDVLRDRAEAIGRVVESVAGAADVNVEQLTGLPILRVTVDRDAIARFGIDADQVLAVVESLGARHVGEVMEGQMRFELVVRLDDRSRRDASQMERLLVAASDGRRVPLGQLAHIDLVEQPSTVQREWARRRVVVQANVRDRDVGSFVGEVRQLIRDTVELPTGYYVQFGGQFEHLERARARLQIVVPVALALVLSLLYVSLGGMRDAVLVFTGVPFAVIGGVVALWLRGLPFTISAGVGFVVLFGVAVLGQLVLATSIRQHLAGGAELLAAIRQGAEVRLRPVLMTALVAAFGFLPMALNTGIGAEVQRPLATVVVGGIITSTLATLLVLPVLYAMFGRVQERG